jgi:hypothetical protein
MHIIFNMSFKLGHVSISKRCIQIYILNVVSHISLFNFNVNLQDRARLIPKKYRCSPNTVKYCALMCSNYVAELIKVCKFIKIVNSKVCP